MPVEVRDSGASCCLVDVLAQELVAISHQLRAGLFEDPLKTSALVAARPFEHEALEPAPLVGVEQCLVFAVHHCLAESVRDVRPPDAAGVEDAEQEGEVFIPPLPPVFFEDFHDVVPALVSLAPVGDKDTNEDDHADHCGEGADLTARYTDRHIARDTAQQRHGGVGQQPLLPAFAGGDAGSRDEDRGDDDPQEEAEHVGSHGEVEEHLVADRGDGAGYEDRDAPECVGRGEETFLVERGHCCLLSQE